MSEKHRSLASYFEEPGEISQSWHDQTEPLQAPPSLSGLGNSSHTGLTGYTYVPGSASMLWVPPGKKLADHTKNPEGTTYHYKGQDWQPTDWGYKEHMQMLQQAEQKSNQPKAPKKKMNAAERKAYKETMHDTRQKTRASHSKDVQELHQSTYTLLTSNYKWDEQIHSVIIDITAVLEAAKTASHDKSSELKSAGKIGRAKKELLHAEKTYLIDDSNWTGESGWLVYIDSFCRRYNLMNTLGMKLPEANEDGSRYLSVAIMFLSKAKEVIMSGMLHHLVQKAKQGTASSDECEFVNASYAAKNLIAKIRGKDRYMRAYDPKLEDSVELGKCRHMIMELEKARWRHLAKGNKTPTPLPKHFQMAPPGQKREGGKKRDKGNHDKGKLERVTDPDLLFKLKELEILKRIMNMHPTETKKGKGRHSQPGPQKQETSSTTAPTTRKSKKSTAAYMHGYYY